jgi:glycolate oxidase FAD binding subunit
LPSVFEPESIAAAAELLAAGGSISIERDGGDVVLSTVRLNRVLEHQPGDLTVIVESGIRLSDLQARLAPHRQMLALDPPGDPTIGACLAGDLSGPRRHRYGAMRDLVIGVTVVLADGTIASSGGKVVKNVAGFDLGKLFCGSRGRLGLVARVALRLHPRPRNERTLVGPAGLWPAVHRSQLDPTAADLLWPDRLALLVAGGRSFDGFEDADPSVWQESAALQVRGTKVRWDGRACLLARPGPGIAYVEGARQEWSPLAERVRAVFDPEGVLA